MNTNEPRHNKVRNVRQRLQLGLISSIERLPDSTLDKILDDIQNYPPQQSAPPAKLAECQSRIK
jgi:hypothetical protein